MLVRQEGKLAAISGVLVAAANGTHGEHVHLEDVAQVSEVDRNAAIAVAQGLDPFVVDVACAPRAVFVDGADGERTTGPGRRGGSSLCTPWS
jgi:hypothetical protein